VDNVIQCPTCSKKYRLKGAPPPTFECRGCGTVMDLSGFAQPAAAAPPPAQPAPPPAAAPAGPAGRGGVPHRRAARARSHARGRRGRHHGHEDDHGYDDEGGRHHYHSKGPNQGLVFGSAIVVVVALVAFIIWVSRDKSQPVEEKKEVAVAPPIDMTPDEPELEAPPPKKRTPKVPKGREDEKRPELREGLLENVPIPEGKRKYRASQAEIQTYPWPDYVTAEERNKIEEAVTNLELGGIDAQDAERFLIKLDARGDDGKLKPGEEFKGVGRVVSEFKNILDEYGGEVGDRLCLARLMQLDRILRNIDGCMQRDFGDREGIRSQSVDRHVKLVIKRWNWWYDLEKWRMRREPWDETLDLEDPEAMEGEGFGDEDDELPPDD